MKSLRSHLFVIGCILMSLCSPAWATTLTYDQPTPGTISSVAQTNAYTLSVNANDVLNFTVVTTKSTSGTLGPCILLYNSTGTPVLDSAGGNYSQVVEMSYQIPATGTYNVLIEDCAGTATGNYTLSTTCIGKCLLPVPSAASMSPTSALAGGPA